MRTFMTDRTPPLTHRVLPLLIGLMMGACAGPEGTTRSTGVAPSPAQPESASGLTSKPGWRFQRQAVAAANPLATEAGAQVLRAGGSAVDAAIAVQMVLTLVEPQSSGIGGGAFLLHFDGRRVVAYDGRETAPAAATERLFLDDQGQPLPFADAVVSGRAVGVPGTVALLALMLAVLPWMAWAAFPPSARLADTDLVLNGHGVRYRVVFKVYEMGLYTSRKVGTVEEFQSDNGAKRLEMRQRPPSRR